LTDIGQLILQNGYIAAQLQANMPEGSDVSAVSFPGVLISPPYMYILETQYTNEWINAMENNEFNISQDILPKTVLYTNHVRNESYFQFKFNRVQGKELICPESLNMINGYNIFEKKNEIISGLLMLNGLCKGYLDKGYYDTHLNYLPKCQVSTAFPSNYPGPKKIY